MCHIKCGLKRATKNIPRDICRCKNWDPVYLLIMTKIQVKKCLGWYTDNKRGFSQCHSGSPHCPQSSFVHLPALFLIMRSHSCVKSEQVMTLSTPYIMFYSFSTASVVSIVIEMYENMYSESFGKYIFAVLWQKKSFLMLFCGIISSPHNFISVQFSCPRVYTQ